MNQTIEKSQEEHITVQVMDENMVCIPVSEYREMAVKAAMLDTLAADIRRNVDEGMSDYSVVNPDLVRVLTGTAGYQREDKGDE